MASKNDQSNYLTTHDTAIMLDLSVGTIQKLVDRNILEAYRTSGGHRRIFFDSVKKYIDNRNAESPRKYIVDIDETTTCLVLNENNPEFKSFLPKNSLVAKDPIDLIYFNENIKNIIIDAETPWLNFQNMSQAKYFSSMNFAMIFNCQVLDDDIVEKLSSFYNIEKNPINTDTLNGLIFGLSRNKK